MFDCFEKCLQLKLRYEQQILHGIHARGLHWQDVDSLSAGNNVKMEYVALSRFYLG